jgi:hypothetical protein
VAIYAYAAFHDERNTFIRQRRKGVALWNHLGPLVQPYARLDYTGHLRYALAAVEYRQFPLMRLSAFSHLLEMTYNEVEAHVAHSHEVSKQLVLEMARVATQHRVTLVVAGIMDDELTHELLTFVHGQGLPVLDLAAGLTAEAYWNAPHDGGHPSARANRVYAARLGAFLRREVLTHEPADRDREAR